jgi:predicted RNA binding protein YcfA (HicA-like mRNA interferase family)
MKVGEVIRIIEADGWKLHSQNGSHRQFTHASKSGRVTVAGKPSMDLHPKTLSSIFNQAQIEKPKR